MLWHVSERAFMSFIPFMIFMSAFAP